MYYEWVVRHWPLKGHHNYLHIKEGRQLDQVGDHEEEIKSIEWFSQHLPQQQTQLQ